MKGKNNINQSFNIGPIEVSKIGKDISIINKATNEQNNDFIENMADNYEKNKLQIDILIEQIREQISICNPLEILKYAYERFIESSGGVAAEVNLTAQDVNISREIEYIQSVLVSSENKYDPNKKDINTQEIFKDISYKINQLYTLTHINTISKTAYLKKYKNLDINLETEELLIEAQNSMFVRGDRYLVYEIPHLKALLEPHNDELVKLYGITVNEFIEGMSNIQKSLLSNKNIFAKYFGEYGNEFVKFLTLVEKYERDILKYGYEPTEKEMKEFISNIKNSDEFLNEYYNFDLENITNFPKNLLEDLSYKLNENNYFYNNDYSGYPIIELPVFSKPFINIDNKFYTFDYYNLFDNIYRVMQKIIRNKDYSYKDEWMSRQKEVSEKMVEDLFKKLLPNCTTYRSNYYPVNKSLKQLNENDLLVIYDDNLIIIEVKAGSYSYRAPILDLDSHINSLKTLVEKAAGQAERTLEYFQSNKNAKIYDSNKKDKKEKCEINIDNFNEITLMCITLDNFNEFCAKIEKMKFLNINKNTIAISIDDLRVYSDYFDSPLEFLHYLKQRKIATQNKSLYLNDELDHLGMYIEKPWYSKSFELEKNRRVLAYGYREALDEYFVRLINKGFEIDKPKQKIPLEIQKIFDYLCNNEIKGRVKLSSYLLDFSFKTRDNINELISKTLIKQKQIKRMLQINSNGDAAMCIFCHQEGVEEVSLNECKEYTLTNMVAMKDNLRLELNIFYNINNEITNIKFQFHKISELTKEKVSELSKRAEEIKSYRINLYKEKNNVKKIGRNDSCPCGSGKKYKSCCGK